MPRKNRKSSEKEERAILVKRGHARGWWHVHLNPKRFKRRDGDSLIGELRNDGPKEGWSIHLFTEGMDATIRGYKTKHEAAMATFYIWHGGVIPLKETFVPA